jgi:hypothetical protein
VAQTKAKRDRNKLVRQGKINPELNRLSWNGLEPSTRLTPTLSERKERLQHKHKWNRSLHGSDGSIFILWKVI